MTKFRLSPVLLVLSGLTLPGVASAQSACDPSAPVAGDVVRCSGDGEGVVDSALDNAVFYVLPNARISGAAQAFRFGDNVTFYNEGFLIGQGDHGVQGGDNATVLNYGWIEGDGGDGVNIDSGRIINNGMIMGSDDGVQIDADGAYVVNNEGAAIFGADEGVNINVDNATLINNGYISGQDDGVNAGENAYIVNYGAIASNGGDQDAIDLDSGRVINYGVIFTVGSEDGIDFDPSTQDSLVVNEGLIEGNIAINTDDADTAAQTVINNGTLRGRGGIAVNLGAGDDVLRLGFNAVVEGLIEMGDGTDTVSIAGIRARTLTFGSLPEVLDYAGPGLLVGTTLALIDPMPLSGGARLARDAAFGASDAVFARQSMEEGFVGVFGSGSEILAANGLQGAETRSGGIVAGQGFGAVAGFLAVTRSSMAFDDGAHRLEQDAFLVGFAHEQATGSAHSRLAALAYVGATRGELRSPSTLSGDADLSGMLVGLGLRYADAFGGTEAAPLLDMTAQLDLVHHRMGDYALSGLGGSVGDHGATGYGLHLDLGLPRPISGGVLRPYLFGNLRGGSEQAMTFAMGGGSTSFAAVDLLGDSNYGLGVSYSSGLVSAGVEWARGRDDARALAAQVSFRLAF